MVYKWLNFGLSLVYPHFCLLCGNHSSADYMLCPECRADLPRLGQACPRCANPLNIEATSQAICGDCLTRPPCFDQTISPFRYQTPINRLIAQLKYQRQLSLVPLLSDALAKEIDARPSVDALLPVPLHNSKLRQRGFNQALELARPIAKEFDLPLLNHIQRHKPTASQLSLHAHQRRANVQGAFRITRSTQYKRVAIVDDVMTTGSTANEIARLLKEDGAEHIEVWCIARA